MLQPFSFLRSLIKSHTGKSELDDRHARLARHLQGADEHRTNLIDAVAYHSLKNFYDWDRSPPPQRLIETVQRLIGDLIDQEGLYAPSPGEQDSSGLGDVWRSSEATNRRLHFFDNLDVQTVFGQAIEVMIAEMLDQIPRDAVFSDIVAQDLALSAPITPFMEKPAELVQAISDVVSLDAVVDADMLPRLRRQVETNLYHASKIDLEELRVREDFEIRKRIVPAQQARDQSPETIISNYLGGTPFETFLTQDIPFTIPPKPRFEHMHVVGGTGHGKTQALQHLLVHDIEQVQAGHSSVCVIDSQGDMIDTILHLAEFDPHVSDSIADRLVLIDPNDIAYPPCLNLFDFGLDRLDRYGALDREKLLNGAVALYEYIFGALLGADLTQRQTVIFRYLARLMVAVPGSTVHTLRDFMEHPESAEQHFDKLDENTRHFFQNEFLKTSFNDTRQQIRTRLWGVLSNAVLERMFANPKNKVNLFDAFNDGSIVLINTAKDLLKEEGCQIFGRFFISLIAQAAQERASMPATERRPTYVYIDEAQDYFDSSVEVLLSQARKYSFGLILAHQNLNQFDRDLLASVTASTSIKMAGGVNDKDANAFAREMRCDSDFIRNMRKRQKHTEFACWIKNTTERPIKLTVPFGSMERKERLSEHAYDALIQANRQRYGASADDMRNDDTVGKASVASGTFDLGEHELL